MEENIGSIVVEHLSNKLNVHILDVDFLLNPQLPALAADIDQQLAFQLTGTNLEVFVQSHDRFVELFLQPQIKSSRRREP